MVEFPTITFLVVEDLFDRYTIVVNETTNDTSVYCEECDVWVNTYSGNQLTTVMPDDLYEMIIDDHEHQVKGIPVDIADSNSSELL